MAARPHSRPIPDILKPPNGTSEGTKLNVFIHTDPASNASLTRCAFPRSFVKTPPVKSIDNF